MDDFYSLETGSAEYVIDAGSHIESPEISETLFESFDGIFIESGADPYSEMDFEYLSENTQTGDIAEKASEKGVPLFFVDLPERYEKGSLKGFYQSFKETGLKKILPAYLALEGVSSGLFSAGLLAIPFLSDVAGAGAIKGFPERVSGYMQLSNFYTSEGLRSAVSADKMEKIADKEYKSKPEFFVEYGAGHLDIIPYLENEGLRRSVISLHSRTGLSGRDGSFMDRYGRMVFAGDDAYRTVLKEFE